MARLFATADDVAAHNARSQDAWRRQRGLGDTIAPIEQPKPVERPVVPLEKDIQREIRDALMLHGAVENVFRFNSGAHAVDDGKGPRRWIRYHDVPGMPDLVCCLKLRYGTKLAFIEVKRPGEQPTFKQAAFLEAVTAKGHVGFVASNAADAFDRLTQELAA